MLRASLDAAAVRATAEMGVNVVLTVLAQNVVMFSAI
jgi:hypothetical protein